MLIAMDTSCGFLRWVLVQNYSHMSGMYSPLKTLAIFPCWVMVTNKFTTCLQLALSTHAACCGIHIRHLTCLQCRDCSERVLRVLYVDQALCLHPCVCNVEKLPVPFLWCGVIAMHTSRKFPPLLRHGCLSIPNVFNAESSQRTRFLYR